MATINNLEARILSTGLRSDRNGIVGLVRARIISGEEEKELTENSGTWDIIYSGWGTTNIRVHAGTCDMDCGWDEDYDDLPAVNLFPENNNKIRREEVELDPIDPLEYF